MPYNLYENKYCYEFEKLFVYTIPIGTSMLNL